MATRDHVDGAVQSRAEPSRDLGGMGWLKLWKPEGDNTSRAPAVPKQDSPLSLEKPQSLSQKEEERRARGSQAATLSSATLSSGAEGRKSCDKSLVQHLDKNAKVLWLPGCRQIQNIPA